MAFDSRGPEGSHDRKPIKSLVLMQYPPPLIFPIKPTTPAREQYFGSDQCKGCSGWGEQYQGYTNERGVSVSTLLLPCKVCGGTKKKPA
ncbi:MAG: hypothetical protein V4449_01270 [Patescibacteria group bacterium]